jgi:hypothetical protein
MTAAENARLRAASGSGCWSRRTRCCAVPRVPVTGQPDGKRCTRSSANWPATGSPSPAKCSRSRRPYYRWLESAVIDADLEQAHRADALCDERAESPLVTVGGTSPICWGCAPSGWSGWRSRSSSSASPRLSTSQVSQMPEARQEVEQVRTDQSTPARTCSFAAEAQVLKALRAGAPCRSTP